eukprot:gene19445-biopygen20258
MPASGDATAAYVALSRVRRIQDLHILRDFDAASLRRSGTKAGVDILLQRLRGSLGRRDRRCLDCLELDRQERATLRCKRVCYGHLCHGTLQPRTAFNKRQRANTVAKPVCLRCSADARVHLKCHGTCRRLLPVALFSDHQLRDRSTAVCTTCASSNQVAAGNPAVAASNVTNAARAAASMMTILHKREAGGYY